MKMLCLALCVAALGFAAASCGGDNSSSSTTTTGETGRTYPNIIVTKQSPVPPTKTAPPPPTRPQADVVRVTIKNGKPVGGIERVRVKKGRPVLVVVRSDVADEVHIHGYDIMADVAAGGIVRIPFTAKIPGVFEVELEGRGLKIAEITVQ